MQEYGGAVVEWMGARYGRLDPGDRDWERSEEGTRDSHREDRRAEVMRVARDSYLCTRAGTADQRVAFKDGGGNASGRQGDRGGKTVGAGADDCRCCHKREKIDVEFLFLRCGASGRENSNALDGVG